MQLWEKGHSTLDPVDGQHHSAEEARDAIRALRDAYFVRVRNWATWKLKDNCEATADDVILTTWERFIQGTRTWPIGVSIEVCFWNAVRSEISNAWEKHQRQVRRLPNAPLDHDGEPAEVLERIEGTLDDPLTAMLNAGERERLQSISDHIENNFKDDDAVTAVIIGRIEKMSPHAVQQEFSLTATQFQSACKRLRRFIIKHYSNGWKRHGQLRQESEGIS